MRFNWKLLLLALLFAGTACSDTGGQTSEPATIAKSVALDIKVTSALARVGERITLSSIEINNGVAISEYRWTFSDGQTLTGKEVSPSFPTSGVVTVKLEAISAGAPAATAEAQLSIVDAGAFAPAALGLPAKLGDIDNDKTLKLDDALLVGQATQGLVALDRDTLERADMNLDGRVNAADVALMQKAIVRNETLPRALLAADARAGAVVGIVSPDLTATGTSVAIEVDGQRSTQILRTVRGYATFVVPDGVMKGSSPASVNLIVDGVIKDRLSLTILDAPTMPSDAKADVLQLLTDLETAINGQQAALREQVATLGLSSEEGRGLLAAGEAGLIDLRDIRTQFMTVFNGPNGTDIARAFQRALYANGLNELRSGGVTTLSSTRTLASSVPDQLCDVVVPALCKLKKFASTVSTASGVVSGACSVTAATIFVGSLATGQLEIVPAAAQLFVNVCLRLEIGLEFASAVGDLVSPIDPALRMSASKTTLASGESAIVRTEITFVGVQEICEFGAGVAAEKLLTQRLGDKIVKRLLTRSVALKALARIFALVGEKTFASLLTYINEGATNVLEGSQIAGAITGFAAKLCPKIGFGAAQAVAANIIQSPAADEGILSFKSDGTAEYFCPPPGPVFKSQINLIGSKELCGGEISRAQVMMTCATSPVTITMGDNGSALDDIFEVVVNGRTVLTSSVPVRSISTTLQLAKGRTGIIMRGLAAPDGVGTYFINFSGAAVVGGDALSGTDLIPGSSKRFIIEVR